MSDAVRFLGIAILVIVAIFRVSDKMEPNAVSPAQQAVSGLLYEMSVTNYDFLWEYDRLRLEALKRFKGKYDRGSFVPPAWFESEMNLLNNAESMSEAREIMLRVSRRLYAGQEGPDFDYGRSTARQIVNPSGPKPEGVCGDCNGTGKVGDGRIFTECFACGGDGLIDDSDRKEEVPVVETSAKESAGDQVSRGPACDNAGGNCGSTRSRVGFPALRRLFGR